MTDFASEWESLPAQEPAKGGDYTVEIHGTGTPTAAPAKTDYAAEWGALPSAAEAPAAVQTGTAGQPSPPATTTPIDWARDDPLREAGRGAGEIATHLVKGAAGQIASGLGNIYDVARGGSMMAPLTSGARMSDWINSLGGEPQTYVGRYGSQALDVLGSLPARFVGQPLGHLAERMGAPPSVSAAVETAGTVAAPIAAAKVAARLNVPRETAPRVEPTLGAAPGASPGVVAGAGTRGGAAGEPVPAGATGGAPGGGAANASIGAGAGAPSVSSVPAEFAGIATPREQLPATAQVPNSARQFFPAVKKQTIGADLPESVRANRAQVLHAIGIDETPAKFREGALTGNPKTQASEHMTSLVPGPLGALEQQTFAAEQAALRNYGDRIRDAAGGTQSGPELPQEQALQIRGQNIVQPLDQLERWYNKQASDLYAQAREKAGESAEVPTTNLDALLADKQFQGKLSSSTEGQHFNNWLQSQAETFKTGGFGGNNVAAAENFRQLLNDANPAMSRTIAKVKEALDSDVAQAGGADTFKAARSMWQQYKQTLGDPKGISSLLEDEKGNRTVPFNQVSTKISTMPDLDQFSHVINTLKNIRNISGIDDATVAASNKALQEIRQQFAENAINAGGKSAGWDPIKFNDTVNKNAYRMGQVFSPDELQTFRTLNDAGFILDKQHAYPGAAAQGLTLAQTLGMKVGGMAAGGLTGYFTGGASAGALEGAAGQAMGGFLADRAALARVNTLQRRRQANVEKYFPKGAAAP